MTLNEVMTELEDYGNPNTKKVFLNHGVKEPFFGVKVQDLKKIIKKTKKDHSLALELYNTGNSDAMYLAGLMADETKMKKSDLQKWAKNSTWYMISEYTVPWITAETPFAQELGLEWIESDKEHIASAGWSTLSNHISLRKDEELDLKLLEQLLKRVEKDVHESQNRVRYTMNSFVIAVGSFVVPLSKNAVKVAEIIGKVDVNVGNTSCKVALATQYIQKVIARGSQGKKRKMARF